MRVLKEDPERYRVNCHCGAHLEYERDDIQKDPKLGIRYVICPVCGLRMIHWDLYLVKEEVSSASDIVSGFDV